MNQCFGSLGTGADLGVSRLEAGVLAGKPDLVFVEFAVDDGGTPDAIIDSAMEDVVRQIKAANWATDICLVYTRTFGMLKDYRLGREPRMVALKERIAKRYGLPSVKVGGEAAYAILDGRLGQYEFARDGVHPSDVSYALYLDDSCAPHEPQAEGPAGPGSTLLPLRPDHLQAARLASVGAAKVKGWAVEDEPWVGRFQHGLAVDQPRSEIALRSEGGTIWLLY